MGIDLGFPAYFTLRQLVPWQKRLNFIVGQFFCCTLPKIPDIPSLKLTWPLKIGLPNWKVVFQPSILRGYVSFREGR